jgi:plasmid stability protein
MPDILVRDVPEDVAAALDARAARAGLSRSELLRREWSAQAARATETVAVDHFREFAETFSELSDPDVMHSAWS